MSIRTAEPRGRVVILTTGEAYVIDRARLDHVKLSNAGFGVLCSLIGRDSMLKIDAGEQTYAIAIYSSIIDEDNDVVWTANEAGWTRTPDLVKS